MFRRCQRVDDRPRRVPFSPQMLEPRLMLAADVREALPVEVSVDTVDDSKSIVFVDASIPDLETMTRGIPPDAELVLLPKSGDGLKAISDVLATRSWLSSVHVISHGRPGELQLSGRSFGVEELRERQSAIRAWGQSIRPEGDILFYGCDVADGSRGRQFLELFSKLTGASVAASSDRTGSRAEGGDWDLEVAIGEIQAPLVVSPLSRREYRSVLSITVYAAGMTGEEQMELQIDGQAVRQWTVGGDVASGMFESFVFENVEPVTADRIRIAFTNDRNTAGVDRNLVVDRLEIDGVVYHTEDESTFSTGSWAADTGAVVPGFRRDEWLHTDGFFQFADQNATTIAVDVAGTTGEERLRLTVGDLTLATWELTTADDTYVATLDRVLGPSDEIRVEFLNDLYLPDIDFDRNVVVDEIRVNGESRLSVDAETYSTGTWTEEDGIVPGYGRGSLLHTNGYFQFDSPRSMITVRARGDVGVESLTLRIAGVDAQTFNVNTEFQEFTYEHVGPVSFNDLRLVYTGDLSAPRQDPNLTVDWAEIDGWRLETDSPFVFSSGVFVDASQAIESGYGLGETLNADGYFQFATGSRVEVIASGALGGEDFELVLGTVRRAKETVGTEMGTYRYIADGVVRANEVRILYDSDLGDPLLGDRNLIVDAIRIDGVTFETEVASTYSSGTGFVDGFTQHGFGHGDTLFVNGFFQYLGVQLAADEFSIPEDAIAVPLAVQANDARSEFNVAIPVVTSEPSNGSLELVDGDLFYTPNAEFIGNDLFQYDVASNNGSRVGLPVSVSITVNASHQQSQSLINPNV
ncbi:MAG: carbohydrate-binding domain-containing protein, partial [Planctomycetota bacterium]